MSKKELKQLREKIESEGLEYAILEYTSDIEDEEFQDLIIAYNEARQNILKFLKLEELIF